MTADTFRRGSGTIVGDRRGHGGQNARGDLGGRRAIERTMAGHHLVEHDPEAEDIRGWRDLAAADLFRRHVVEGAHDRAGTRVDLSDGIGTESRAELGQPEIEDFRVAIRPDHHVLGLHVAMDDPRRMRGSQSGRDLNAQRDGLVERHRPTAKTLSQRLPADELHGDEADPSWLPIS